MTSSTDKLQSPADGQSISRTAAADGLYVQYGCGICAPVEWLNFDASPRLWFERIPGLSGVLRHSIGVLFPPNVRWGDIVRGLPVPDNSARGVYCSHILEHIPRDDLAPALRNTMRILKPGGVFRLVVPDLQWRASRYLADAASGNCHAADQFMMAANLGQSSASKDAISLARRYFGNSAHLWMYDFASLKQKLEDAGFMAVRRCDLGDARDQMFSLVEDSGRFMDAGERELAIEAVRG